MYLTINDFVDKILQLNSANISDKEVFKLAEFLAYANIKDHGFILYTHFSFYLKKHFKQSNRSIGEVLVDILQKEQEIRITFNEISET